MSGRTKETIDPVCHMSVDPKRTAAHHKRHWMTYHFCSQHCADRFAADPGSFVTEPVR